MVAGPSGVGKGSLVTALMSRDPDGLARSVSATTRAPRPNEVNQVDYRFVSDGVFDDMIRDGEFLEWAEVFAGNRYGTPRAEVERLRVGGRDVVLEIDVQGAAQVKEEVSDAVLILLAPPSMAALEARLRGRATETDASIAERLAAAERELQQASWFDHRVVNDDLDRAVGEVAAIIEASRTT